MRENFKPWILLFFFSLCFFLPVLSSGQLSGTQKADSLREALAMTNGTDKILLQLELALQIHETNENEALELANAALESAIETGNDNLEMRACYVLGRTYFVHNEIGLSETFYNRALRISNKTGENGYKGEILFRKGVIEQRKGESIQALDFFNESIQVSRLAENYKSAGSSYSMMGTIFRLNGLYDRAIEYIIKSKLNYERAGFTEGDAWAAYLLGRIYADLKLPEKALDYFNESMEKYQKMAAIDGNYNGVAICFEQIGLLNLESGNFEVAREYINRVLDIHKQSGSEYGLSNAYKYLGKIEYYFQNYEKAENYLNEALAIKKEINDLLSLPGIYEYIGLCHIGKGKISEGISNIEHGLDLALANDQVKIQLEIYSNLEDVYLNLNDLKKVIFYQKKQIETQEIILSGAANIKIDQLQAIYELDEKNNQIATLEKQNELNRLRIKQQKTYQLLMIAGFLFVLIISVIIFSLYRKLRLNNRELNRINTTKDRLFSIIAHDLKGSIGSALALSKILTEDAELKKQSGEKKYLPLIFQSLNSSYDLLNNLLEWALSQFQKIEFKPEHLILNDVVDDVRKQMVTLSQTKNVAIEIKAEDSQKVFADKGFLKTILRNLLSNAIKFSSPGSKVIFSAQHRDGSVEISVKDFGVGIDSKVIPRLFDLGSNASTSGTMGENGTGLGLILVKEFVEKHDGKIWVDSEVGRGSTFYFTLPHNP
jgi:signal transduction histidine kinase